MILNFGEPNHDGSATTFPDWPFPGGPRPVPVGQWINLTGTVADTSQAVGASSDGVEEIRP